MSDHDGLPDIDTLWDYSRPDVSEARFREVLPRAQRSVNRDYHLQLLTQIARAQGLQRQYDDAHATLDVVRDRLSEGGPAARVRYLLERGRCFNDTKKHADAKACFVEAWEVGRTEGLDAPAVDAAHMMGIVEAGEESLAWNVKAMEHAKASADPKARRWLASLQNNIGWTYHGMGRYEDALGVFEEALRLRVEQGKAENIRIARWSVAKMHRLLGRAGQALEVQRQLREELEAAGEPDGFVFEEMGECLLALGRGDEARPQFARAHELLSKDAWFAANEAQRLERMKTLGGIA